MNEWLQKGDKSFAYFITKNKYTDGKEIKFRLSKLLIVSLDQWCVKSKLEISVGFGSDAKYLFAN